MYKENEKRLEDILSPKRDYVPVSSAGVLEGFLSTSVYKDFLSEVKLRIEDMRDFYETCPHEQYMETRGALAALRLIGGIFTDLHHNAVEAIDNKELEKEDGIQSSDNNNEF
jgi:hypothetical protein